MSMIVPILIMIYLIATMVIGVWSASRVKTSDDFQVAGRKLPFLMSSCVIFATWFGSETILGSSSKFLQHGLLGVIEDPFGAALCLFLVGAFIAKKLYQLNLHTIGDYFRMRYSPTIEMISSIFMVLSYIGWIAAQFLAMAYLLSIIFQIPPQSGLVISMIFVASYTLIGGMWSVAATDIVQTVIIGVGLISLLLIQAVQTNGFEVAISTLQPGFLRFLPQPHIKDWLHYIAAWITVGFGSIPQQDVFQRIMSAKSQQVAQKSSYLSAIIYLVIGLIPLWLAYNMTVLHPEIMSGNLQQNILYGIVHYTSPVVQVLFFGALLSAILSTASGAILAPATVLVENVIGARTRFKLNDSTVLLILRIAVAVIAFFAYWVTRHHTSIFDLVSQSSAISLVTLFVPLVFGIYYKKANTKGALLSIIFGYIGFKMAPTITPDIPPVIIGLAVSILAMVLGSRK
jgi:SSS family solute:Na+ symporter